MLSRNLDVRYLFPQIVSLAELIVIALKPRTGTIRDPGNRLLWYKLIIVKDFKGQDPPSVLQCFQILFKDIRCPQYQKLT